MPMILPINGIDAIFSPGVIYFEFGIEAQ